VEVLETYELGWWVSRLRPIFDEFVLAAEGHPTREFWQAIYKPQWAYGDTSITGWITDLFPYLGDPPKRVRNGVLSFERKKWALPLMEGTQRKNAPERSFGVGLSTFPSGLSSVPVRVKFQHGASRDLELIGGFLAVEENPSTMALSPVIGWCVGGAIPGYEYPEPPAFKPTDDVPPSPSRRL